MPIPNHPTPPPSEVKWLTPNKKRFLACHLSLLNVSQNIFIFLLPHVNFELKYNACIFPGRVIVSTGTMSNC